ncbi:MAG TPA: phospholipase D family protein [Chryseolinea sp.]
MAKFLAEDELNAEVSKVISEAKENLILISPFIKFHARLRDILKSKMEDHKLQITVIYGKNALEKSKSLSADDVLFLKQFPNIEIRYEQRLHAKYYANESSAILTSMNLYGYSHDNNIEFGIKTTKSLIDTFDSIDGKAWKFFERVIQNSQLEFKRKPNYEKVLLGFMENYIGSVVTIDKFSSDGWDKKLLSDVPVMTFGFCIRTGKKIKFDLQMPFTNEAYLEWSKYGNENYPEKYCHFSGEPSNKETSKAKPVLQRYWQRAKDIHGF